ncbi:hypothetical protein CXZ10_11460 [Pleomorphomonas diazotrophica]|uniref:BON domain-containing protein n=1 Tax=Pleomorphomonas diazotrophica TaxID=1166257 RepID=A0A1I4WIQ2_9HYPH|nr:BON domain-containing protein [Pleomorphomonas diazotrophica]PKR89124.1 hypothetical protein CXZ10_11460 [Pleomorphomonas diazotrophica]SFN12909.1 BON domain-containing protein [Pleomorphomonas diazotrophica]
MANGRNERDFPSRDYDDDRQRLTGRWVQDDETGSLRRRFDEFDRDDEAFRGRRGYEGRRDWGDTGGYYGAPRRGVERDGGGHAFDFARRDSGRSDLGSRGGNRSFEGRDRFNEGYGVRSGTERDYDDHDDQSFPGDSPRGGWPQRGNWISRYVSAEARADEGRFAGSTGSFRGKGPKGYVRSDERIKEDVSDRLSDDDTLDASDITVEVSGGEVTLTGYVDSRQAKRTAEDCAEQCAGVRHVQNNLRVRSAGDPMVDQTVNKAKTTDL